MRSPKSSWTVGFLCALIPAWPLHAQGADAHLTDEVSKIRAEVAYSNLALRGYTWTEHTEVLVKGKLQSASDANGTGAADITGATFGTNTANSTSTVVVDPKKVVGGFLGYVGTIATGPSLVSVVAAAKKKIV